MDLSSLPKQKWWGNDCLYQLNGFWLLPQFLPSIDRVIRHFKPLPNDIVLASFPKTGTTWLKSLVFSIVHRSTSTHHLATAHPHDLVPTLEVQVYAAPDLPPAPGPTFPGPARIFSTHIPYQLLSETLAGSRVVYMTRNPKDTFVSMWHFVNRWKRPEDQDPWPLDAAADSFCRGVVPCGCYYDHVVGYREVSLERPGSVMFVTYEEMMGDPESEVRRLGEFLGRPFEAGEEGEREVRRIVEECSFEVLSRHEVNRSEESPEWFQLPYSSFFRKGGVGDYRNCLSDEVVERFDELTTHKFHSLGFFYGI